MLNVFDAWQEHAAALAEGQPAPALCSSGDVRDLNMEDFKYAHQQVWNEISFKQSPLQFIIIIIIITQVKWPWLY